MNRLSTCRQARHPRSQAVLFLLLLGALPGGAVAQKPVATPPAATPALPSPALVTPPALSQKEMLAQDTRLDRPITLDVISVPLNEVLQKESLDKSTETMEDGHRFLLTAAPDCADLKLQVRLNARPLRTLMTALAEMLPGRWTRTPHGYQLSMTKQAAAARAEWWHLFLGEREKALTLQRQAVMAAMQTKAERRKDSDPDPEQSDRTVETDMANQHDFFHSLPLELKTQMTANMDETAFYEVGRVGFGGHMEQFGTFGWLSQMSPQTQEHFKGAMQANTDRMTSFPPAYQHYAVQAKKDMAAFDPSRVYFWFLNAGIGVNAMPINGPPSSGVALLLHVPQTTSVLALTLDQARLAQAVEKMGTSAPDEWKRLAAYQRGRVWPNILPKLLPEDHSAWRPTISRAAQTDWLGERGHMEYVCDYYSHGGYAMPEDQKKQPVRRSLAVELDEMAARRDVSWVKDTDGIYLVRDNRWYRNDNLEVPQPLLRRWFGALLQTRREEIARQQAAAASPKSAGPVAGLESAEVVPQPPAERMAAIKQNWDWAAEVYGALTPWQMRNGLAMFQPEEKDLAPLNDATEAKLDGKFKNHVTQPGEVWPPGFDMFAELTRMPPFSRVVNTLKGYPHTVQLYSSFDDAGRMALLEDRLSASSLSAAQFAQASSLQPFLPQAMQSFPVDSVMLGLGPGSRSSSHVTFMDVRPLDVEVFTPPQAAPPGVP